MEDRTESVGFFRCPVHADQTAATLRMGHRSRSVQLHERSIDGFTIAVTPREAKRFRTGRRGVLATRSERVEVLVEDAAANSQGMILVALRRQRDLTPSEMPRAPLLGGRGAGRGSHSSTAELLFSALAIVLFLVFSLPGLGDSLGTAPRIRGAFRTVVNLFTGSWF